MRTPPLLLMACATALLGAGLAHAASPARCDGRHKRPANPYGSVLAAGLKPAAAPVGTGAPEAPAAAPPSGAPKPAAVSRASFTSCGGLA